MRRAAALGVLIAGVAAVALAASDDSGERRTQAAARGWSALRPATIARTEVTATRVGRHVFVAGGFVEPDGDTTRAVERYDLRTNRWRRVAPLPVALNHAASAAWRGRLYVIGGYRGNRSLSNETRALYRYEPARNRWASLPGMRTARGALGAAVIGDRLYAVGGQGGGRALATLEIFDLRQNRWRSGPAMRRPREHLGVTAAGGRLYVVAGRAAGEGNFRTFERYDPRTNRWTTLPDLIRERGGNTAAAAGGRIVAIGGEEGAGTIREVEAFDPRTGRWRRLPDMRTPRHGLGAVGYRGRVYAIAGGPQPGFSYSRAIEALSLGGQSPQ